MKTLTGICILFLVATSLVLLPGHSTSFVVTAAPAPQAGLSSCSSDDMRRNYCSADVSGGVQLVRQRSDSPCIFNRTWGFMYGRGIWVDRGCRADFQIGGSGFSGWDNGYNIYCASDDMRRNVCPTDTRGGVQIVRQRSESRCEYGRTWGFDRRASGWIAVAAPIFRSAATTAAAIRVLVVRAAPGSPAATEYK